MLYAEDLLIGSWCELEKSSHLNSMVMDSSLCAQMVHGRWKFLKVGWLSSHVERKNNSEPIKTDQCRLLLTLSSCCGRKGMERQSMTAQSASLFFMENYSNQSVLSEVFSACSRLGNGLDSRYAAQYGLTVRSWNMNDSTFTLKYTLPSIHSTVWLSGRTWFPPMRFISVFSARAEVIAALGHDCWLGDYDYSLGGLDPLPWDLPMTLSDDDDNPSIWCTALTMMTLTITWWIYPNPRRVRWCLKCNRAIDVNDCNDWWMFVDVEQDYKTWNRWWLQPIRAETRTTTSHRLENEADGFRWMLKERWVEWNKVY